MQTSGHGNDALMILVPVAVTVVVGVILFGGPTDAVEALNAIVGEIAYETMEMVSTWF
jgi:hypothetical protein